MYAISAIEVTTTADKSEWSGVRQLPIFYLNENVQGITSEEHAESIARELLGSERKLSICAVRV